MKPLHWLALLALVVCSVEPGSAENVQETWRRGGFQSASAVCVNPSDGSCWVGYYGGLVRLSADGTEIWSTEAGWPSSLSVDRTDGSCWMADSSDLVHMAADGTELWRGEDYQCSSVSVNPTDGSCWVAGAEGVKHLDQDGAELARVASFTHARSVSVDPVDGSCWVADRPGNEVIHLAEDASELWRGGDFLQPSLVCVNTADGSCWVANGPTDEAVHLAADGTELLRVGGVQLGSVDWISVNAVDGSCWVADSMNEQIVHRAEDGTELWRGGSFPGAHCVSVNPVDGSCWVAAWNSGEVAHLVICSPFDDIDCENWARDEIAACEQADIVAGYQDGCYHPEYTVTRDQMAAYISRALAGGDDNVPDFLGDPTFPDVPEGDWALDYVEYAADQNVVAGYGDGTYHPDEQVNRAQMAVYVARAMVAPTGEAALADYVPADPRNFPDVPPTGYGDDGTEPYWAYTHVEYCVENGVVQGHLDGKYHPDDVVSRAEMAVYIARAFELVT